MGNVLALDQGSVLLRCTIFDKQNDIFPCKIQKEMKKSGLGLRSVFREDLSFYSKEHGGTFHFFTLKIEEAKTFISTPEFHHLLAFLDKWHVLQKDKAYHFFENLELRKQILDMNGEQELWQASQIRNFVETPILSTGGYNDHFLRFIGHSFNSQIIKCRGDTLQFLIAAIDYLDSYTNDCFFHFSNPSKDVYNSTFKLTQFNENVNSRHYFSLKESLYPYLLVNLRSGGSFYRVESGSQYKRVAGTSIGVSMFTGIVRLLGLYEDVRDAINDSAKGDSARIDMSVKDIYGGDYPGTGLPGDIIASSFARVKDLSPSECQQLNKEDICRSLMTMIAINSLIFSNLVAKITGIKKVVWIGMHQDMPEFMSIIQKGFKFLSRDEARLIFPQYHSFLASLGLLLINSKVNF